MKHKTLYIISLLLIFVSCNKKNKELIITGTVKTSSTSANIQGANVTLSGKIIESGKWTNSYSQLATTTSDNNGKYTLTLDAVRVSEYKLSFTKENYIDDVKIMQPDDVSTDNDNIIDVLLAVKSFLNINVKNIYPINENDYLSLTLSGDFKTCTSCCTDEKFEFKGTNIDQNILCICPGSQNIVLNWDILKGGSVSSHIDTLLVNNFDTANYVINY